MSDHLRNKEESELERDNNPKSVMPSPPFVRGDEGDKQDESMIPSNGGSSAGKEQKKGGNSTEQGKS